MKKFYSFIVKNKAALVLFIIIIGAVFFYFFNPYEQDFFPKCNFYTTTGYKCPGCGTQRALYNIMHLRFAEAARENMALFLILPYVVLGFMVDFLHLKNQIVQKIYSVLFDYRSFLVVFGVVVLYWILRNVV